MQERGSASVRRLTSGWTRSFAGTCETVIGGAENAGVEKAGVEKSEVDSRGGICRSGKCRSDNGWKAVRKEKYKIPTT